MARNIILFLATAAVLVLLFVGYITVFRAPTPENFRSEQRTVDLHVAQTAPDEATIHVDTPRGPVDIPPGEKMESTLYDPMGRPMGNYRCQSWGKVPNSSNLIAVIEPEITLRLNSGMIVQIASARGELDFEWLDAKNYRPKRGTLTGDARITIDRETAYDREPLSERPEDQITIKMDHFDFDLGLGELKSSGPLQVQSEEFTVNGTGLHLIWNQDENRVEKLFIEHGGQMVFQGDFLDTLAPSQKSKSSPATAPAASAVATVQPRRHKPSREPVAYSCIFTENVSIQHFVEDQLRASMSADELTLRMNMGGRGGGNAEKPKPSETPAPAVQPAPAPESQPTSKPASNQSVIVKWTGPLSVHPETVTPEDKLDGRRVEAVGKPLRVELSSGGIACGRLVLHEESKRLWLYPTEAGGVEFSTGQNLTVHASEVTADFNANRIKLIGPVMFQADRSSSGNKPPLTIAADSWAELRLAARKSETQTDANLFANPMAAQSLESAVFVGEVLVTYEDQRLYAHQLTAEFNAARIDVADTEKSPELQGMLKAVTAVGDVRLLVDSDRRAWWRPPSFDRSLTAGSLRLDFIERDGRLGIREMYANGMVELNDRPSEFAARGRELRALFSGRAASAKGVQASLGGSEELESAKVTGSDDQFAFLHAKEYDLSGKEIVVDNRTETLHIDGRAELAFQTDRGLQGFTRSGGEPITVTCTRWLHVDGQADTVEFAGNVMAGGENEHLVGDTMKLFLEDVPAVEQTTVTDSMLSGSILQFAKRAGLIGGRKTSESGVTAAEIAKTRKDLARILATNAGLVAETYAKDSKQVLLYQEIQAPRLEIETRRRYVRTIGPTTMQMTDMRMKRDQQAQSGVDVMSSLTGSGPSQTGMVSQGGMLYMLGEPGPERRDSLLLEGGVRFRRVTGSEMFELDKLLPPDVAVRPDLLKKIESSNTYLECTRLECMLSVPEPTGPAAMSMRSSIEVNMLKADQNVYLNDTRGDNRREIHAEQLEYVRTENVIRIFGEPGKNILARIYDSNVKTGRFSSPVQAAELVLHLDTGTIEARDVTGRIGSR